MSYLEYMNKFIFKPLKMIDTHPEDAERLISNRPRYYIRQKIGDRSPVLKNAPYVDLSMK
jgi:hypothetical protein